MSRLHYCISVVGHANDEALKELLEHVLPRDQDVRDFIKPGEHEITRPTTSVKISIRRINNETGELTNGR